MMQFSAAPLAVILFALAGAAPVLAQDARQAPSALAVQERVPAGLAGPAAPVATEPARPAARPADVASVDAIIAALYDVISGPAGQQRDWDRLRSLFAPEGKMAAVGPRPGGGFGLRSMTVDDYIARNTRYFDESGFFESELARTTETFGQVAHVFSTYQAKHAPGDLKPFVRGVNSVQLYHDGSRWHIASLLWRAEDGKLVLPERYLKSP